MISPSAQTFARATLAASYRCMAKSTTRWEGTALRLRPLLAGRSRNSSSIITPAARSGWLSEVIVWSVVPPLPCAMATGGSFVGFLLIRQRAVVVSVSNWLAQRWITVVKKAAKASFLKRPMAFSSRKPCTRNSASPSHPKQSKNSGTDRVHSSSWKWTSRKKVLQTARYVQENALMVEAQLGQVGGEIREIVAQTDLEMITEVT